jgi:diketogulonate reductase-like aldo/keto reductase
MPTNTITLNDGVQMPAIGLGVFQTPPEVTTAAVEEALRVGYRHVDTRRLPGAGEAPRRRQCPRHRRQQLHARAPRPPPERGIGRAGGQPDRAPPILPADRAAADAEHGVLTQAWSPIGGITSYRPAETSAFDDPTLLEIARGHGTSATQVMLCWHLQQGRSAIPKSTRPARIAENFDVFDFELTTEQLTCVGSAREGARR